MTEGLQGRCYLHTVTATTLCFDNPTVLFAVRSQSTSPSKEVEAYGSSKPLPYQPNGGSKPPPYESTVYIFTARCRQNDRFEGRHKIRL